MNLIKLLLLVIGIACLCRGIFVLGVLSIFLVWLLS